MRHKNHAQFWRVAALALVCLLLMLLPACGKAPAGDVLLCRDEPYSNYAAAMRQVLPDFSVQQYEHTPFVSIKNGQAAEVFDFQARTALRHSMAAYWYPQYLATVVIAVDRAQTDAVIKGWEDLPAAGETVALSVVGSDGAVLLAAAAYGLEGEAYTHKSAIELIAALQAAGHFAHSTFDAPVVICYDYQAVAQMRAGRDFEIIIPQEGTLTYEKGVLSDKALPHMGTAAALLNAGFRLLDGQADPALYPAAENYKPAVKIADYEHFYTEMWSAPTALRREVLHTRLYSSANGREHQLFALLYIILILVWMTYMLNRIMQKGMRRAIFHTGVSLISWMVLRLLKYQISLAGTATLVMWYSFYIFQLFTPLLLLWMAWLVDKPEHAVHPPVWWRLLALWNVLLLLLVFTNDAHGFVFVLNRQLPGWENNYSYGAGYYVIAATYIFTLLAAMGTLLFKSAKNPRRRAIIFPLAFCMLLILYGYGYITRVPLAWESDYTMTMGVFSMLFLESAMQTGLIPVNTRYIQLFTHSSLQMQIMDAGGRVVLSSSAAAPVDEKIRQHVFFGEKKPLIKNEDTLVFAHRITGGFALWQEDISAMNALQKELRASVEKLQAANALLAQRTKIQQAIDEEKEKSRLLLQLEDELAEKNQKLSHLAQNFSTAATQKETAMIALLLCYIKRRSNLFFRRQEASVLPADELAICIDELAEFAGYTGTQVLTANQLHGALPAHHAVLMYDFLYTTLEQLADEECPHALLHIRREGSSLLIRALLPKECEPPVIGARLLADIEAEGGAARMKDLDDSLGFSLMLPAPEGGEADA